jgi:hypothetical protein
MRGRAKLSSLVLVVSILGCSSSEGSGPACHAIQEADGPASATVELGTSRFNCSFVVSNGATSIHYQCSITGCEALDGPPGLEAWSCSSDQTVDEVHCDASTSKDVADYLGVSEVEGGGSYPCTFALTCGTLTETTIAHLIEPTQFCAY